MLDTPEAQAARHASDVCLDKISRGLRAMLRRLERECPAVAPAVLAVMIKYERAIMAADAAHVDALDTALAGNDRGYVERSDAAGAAWDRAALAAQLEFYTSAFRIVGEAMNGPANGA